MAPSQCNASMVLMLSLISATSFISIATAQQFNFQCSGGQSFLSSTRSCINCPAKSSFNFNQQKCVCATPLVASDTTTNSFTCLDCAAATSMPGVPSVGAALACLQCSSNASTTQRPLQAWIAHSSWSASAGRCECPGANYTLTNTFADKVYASFFCVPCGTANCVTPCQSPLVLDSTGTNCVCPSGFTTLASLDGNQCVSQSTVSALLAGATDMTVSAPNVQNSGSTGASVTSAIVQTTYAVSTIGCSLGNATACNALANLCVFSRYDLSKPACSLYRLLQRRESCRGLSCEVPLNLPWLYYLRSSADILHDTSTLTLRAALQPRQGYIQRLRLVVATYSANGTFLGHSVVTDDLNTCDLIAAEAREFWSFGAKREARCQLNLRWFFNAPDALVYELFVQNSDATLFPVPALLDFTNSKSDFVPVNIDDDGLIVSASTSGDPLPNSYKRRFFLYDNVASRTATGGQPQFVTYARRMTLLVNLQPGSKSTVYPPLLIIQYASVLASAALQYADSTDGELRHLRTNVSSGALTDLAIDRVLYVQSTAEAIYAARTTVIILCCVMFLTALGRTYGWMRRQQDLVLGFGALLRFVIYYFNHLANMFLMFDILFCGVFFVFYKYQADVDYLLPEDFTYITATLYTACIMKGLVIIYYVYEQCNADIFVIDWERSKGQLKHGDKDLPVSMWRSTFIANEFNELQVMRGWNVIFTMFIVTAFLDGLGYINAAQSVPATSSGSTAYTTSHPLLRIAVASFFWIVIAVGLNILEYQIYYRFMETHPLQAFVDLCSVSNISIMVLLEPQWGFYIHGESIHAYADASMEEFQHNLEQEAQGNLPTRGINGSQNCQTFEVFLGLTMRQFLNVSYHQLFASQASGLMIAQPVSTNPGCFEFMRKRFSVALTPETLKIKQQINQAFQASVREARRSVLEKFGVHSYIDFPPNILYMNGPFAGERAGGDLFFIDDFKGYGKASLYGIDMDIFTFYLMLFLAIDTGLQNVFGSMALTYLVDICLVTYRQREGEANISRKTMFDDRFFL